MHVATKLGIVAGTIGAGVATGVVVPKLAGGIEQSSGGGLALTAAGASTAALFGSSLRRSVPNPTIGLVGLGAGALLATLGMQQLFAERPNVPRVQYDPADHASSTPTQPSALHPSNHRPGNPDDGSSVPPVVEEEVETYGPGGEWLGTEHGTVEAP